MSKKGAVHSGNGRPESAPPIVQVVPPAPKALLGREIWGYGLEKVDGKYLALRFSSLGRIEVLNPRRGDEVAGETKALAIARLLLAQRYELIGGK